MRQPELLACPGVLTAAQLQQTVSSIASIQDPCGALPWPDGHTDTWDHVECAMALTLGNRLESAAAAYDWLRTTQAPDGSWAMSYAGTRILDHSVDTNQCAYLAVGVWQWWLATGDRQRPHTMWPTVARALDFVVDMQLPGGELGWGQSPLGQRPQEALLTGSASTYQALRCGIAIAELVGSPQPDWELAAGTLSHAVAHHRERFVDKSRYSMDWYYPVLGGSVRGDAAQLLLQSRWDDFVVPGFGIRCVSDRPWVTGAETAELALALTVMGDRERAISLLQDMSHLREEDGSYWTGLVFDEGVRWPVERSAWTAAAMVLACDALAGGSTLRLFAGADLPTGVLVSADACSREDAQCRVSAPAH